MESKHTPGPWKVNEYGNVEQNNGAYHLVATCSGISSNLKERESNAQLIACAPEMLEALKQNLITIKDLLMAIGPEDELPIDQDLRVAESPEIIKLKAIIKKAEGGNS